MRRRQPPVVQQRIAAHAPRHGRCKGPTVGYCRATVRLRVGLHKQLTIVHLHVVRSSCRRNESLAALLQSRNPVAQLAVTPSDRQTLQAYFFTPPAGSSLSACRAALCSASLHNLFKVNRSFRDRPPSPLARAKRAAARVARVRTLRGVRAAHMPQDQVPAGLGRS